MEKLMTTESTVIARLRVFEETYGMSSEEFYTRWERNELSHDDDDLFDWAGLCGYLGVGELDLA